MVVLFCTPREYFTKRAFLVCIREERVLYTTNSVDFAAAALRFHYLDIISDCDLDG